MTSNDTPIIRRGLPGPHGRWIHQVDDRANGFTIGRIVRVRVPSVGRRPITQWWAWTDTGHELGPHRRRCDAARAIFDHYRKWDTMRYACGRMAA
ncbi:MAG: hypothetical protein R3246_13220 [Acidimicrobiia bacterium]|nr:hypothetical protein [Acidimicrobiia bacterium]